MNENLYKICEKENLSYDELKEAIYDEFGENIFNKNNRALMYVCEFYPKLKLIKLIIDCGSNPNNVLNTVGENCLFYLFLSEQDFDIDVVEYLISLGCNIELKNIYNNNILHEIIIEKVFTLKKLEMLLKFKPDMINEVNRHGTTPLMFLCQCYPDLELIKLFINFGADPKLSTFSNNNCLFYLFYYDKNIDPKIVEFFIDKGCDIYQKNNNNGFTILDLAIRSPGIEKIQRVDLLTKYNLKHCKPSTNENDIFISNFFGFKVAKSFVTYQLYY